MKVVQLGIGGMGNAWLNAVQESDVVEFAGFVEINDEIAAEQVTKYGLDGSTVYQSLAEALDNLDDVDGIVNVTPPRFHRETNNLAMERGIPVLCEKPLSDTLEDARAIVQKSNETGVVCMVAQNYRYSAVAQTVKSILEAETYGALGAVSVNFFKGFGKPVAGFRTEMVHPLIVDMSIHHLDMMRFFLDKEVTSVSARSWNPKWSWFKGDTSAQIALTFAGDIPVSYVGSWSSLGHPTAWNGDWRFECAEKTVILNDDKIFAERQIFGGEATPMEEIPLIEVEHQAQSYLLHEFYRAVTEGITPATTVQDNIKTIELVFACVESADTEFTVRL